MKDKKKQDINPTFCLISVQNFMETYFHPSSRPDARTVRGWVESGEVPGRAIGKKLFVDCVAFESAVKEPANDDSIEPVEVSKSELVSRLMAEMDL